MKRLTRKIKGANNYCGYELKNATYKELFDLKSNSQIEDEVNCDLTIAIDKLGKLEDLMEKYEISSIEALEEIIKDYDELCRDVVKFGLNKFGIDIDIDLEEK